MTFLQVQPDLSRDPDHSSLQHLGTLFLYQLLCTAYHLSIHARPGARCVHMLTILFLMTGVSGEALQCWRVRGAHWSADGYPGELYQNAAMSKSDNPRLPMIGEHPPDNETGLRCQSRPPLLLSCTWFVSCRLCLTSATCVCLSAVQRKAMPGLLLSHRDV